MATDISSHPFVKIVMDRVAAPIKLAAENVMRSSTERKAAQAATRAAMTSAERYDVLIFQKVTGLIGTVGILEDAQRLIGIFPSDLARGSRRIRRDRWVDYHYGAFTVALASISDVGTVLASSVHGLGLAEKHTTHEIVVAHQYIRGTPTASALKALFTAVQLVKERRNAHVHRGDLADIADQSEALSDDFLQNAKVLTFINSIDATKVDKARVRELWRVARRDMDKKLASEFQKIGEPLVALLEALSPVFQARSDLLKLADRAVKK